VSTPWFYSNQTLKTMRNIFNTVQLTKPKRNVFDLSHDVKLSLNMGELVPVCCFECVPGDKFNISAESLIRFAPLVAPVMHRLDQYIHYFFVPNRIIWQDWRYFITNTPVTPGGTDVPAFPYIEYGDVGSGAFEYTRLMDYLGLPKPPTGGIVPERVSALPFAAYQKIVCDYYRDENLQQDAFWLNIDNGGFPVQSGANISDDLVALRNRAWMHDYFTGSLPFAQKGAAVDIPLGTITAQTNGAFAGRWRNAIGGAVAADGTTQQQSGTITTPTGNSVFYDPNGTLVVDATTINDFRRAEKLQMWFEKNARAGTRYTEFIRAHFGVVSSDKRQQRPEYITGVKSPVQISEVLQTSSTDDTTTPQGNMAGHGISVASGKYGSFFCEEHGYIIGIMSVMPRTAYQQGIPRHFSKIVDFTDYYDPDFAHLGEQEVTNREVYARFDGTGGTVPFGYVPRFAEYKFEQSRVAGDFRDSLSFWHLGRIFDAPPDLNEEFIKCVPRDDIFAVEDPDVQKLYAHVLNKVTAVRPMPVFGTPHL